MLISVVIPLFNKASTVRRCVASVLSQIRPADEIVIVDDGSTDGGGNVVTELHSPQVRLRRQDRAGVSAARNRGIHESAGEVIAFLDADDEWKPDFLTEIERLSQCYPGAGALAVAYVFARDKGPSLAEPAFSPLLPREGRVDNYFGAATGWAIPLCSSAIAVRRSTFDEVGYFAVGAAWGEDAEMWARIYLRYPIAYSAERLALYHISASNRATSRVDPRPMMPVVKTLEQALREGRIRPEEASDAERYICQAVSNTVQANILYGHRAFAAEQLKSLRRYRSGQGTYWRLWGLMKSPRWCIRGGLAIRHSLRALLDAGGERPQ
jgi:glycosyltransferase involved in cell wall biosynthesis